MLKVPWREISDTESSLKTKLSITLRFKLIWMVSLLTLNCWSNSSFGFNIVIRSEELGGVFVMMNASSQLIYLMGKWELLKTAIPWDDVVESNTPQSCPLQAKINTSYLKGLKSNKKNAITNR